MTKFFPRFLLVFSALVLATGAFMHASAFHKIVSALNESNLVSFAANALKVLWLMDSAVALILATVFAFAAIRPSAANKWIIVLLSLIPGATAALLYAFMGNFIGGHVMLMAAATASIAGLLYPPSRRD